MFSIVTHPGNEAGRVAVDAYARHLGISSSEFMRRTTLGKRPSMLLN
jgi:hypothetical protein